MAESTPTTGCIVKPPSKTALFTADHEILSNPPVYAMPVEVRTTTSTQRSQWGEAILSQRLRRAAIENWMNKNFDMYPKKYGIAFSEETTEDGAPVDCVLMLFEDPANIQGFKRGIENAMREPDVKKKIRVDQGGIDDQKLWCRAPQGLRIVPVRDSRYWKFLSVIVRRSVLLHEFRDGTLNNSGEILYECGENPRERRELTKWASDPTDKILEKVSVLLRARTKVEGNGTRGYLKFELDLVPGISKESNLADVVIDALGHVPSPGRVRAMLVGLKVKKTYTPPKSRNELLDQRNESQSEPDIHQDDAQSTSAVPTFTIRDIQNPADVKTFAIGKTEGIMDEKNKSNDEEERGEDEKLKRVLKISVKDYFETSKNLFLKSHSLIFAY